MGVGYRPRRRMWLIGFRCTRWVSHAPTVHPAAGRPAGADVACSHARRAAASLSCPPTRSRCRLPSGSGSSSAEKYQLPCPGSSRRRHTHGRASPPGRQPHRWKTRPTRADVARPCPASRGPRTPAQAQPHLRCRHHRARSQAIATAALAAQPPKQHRPPRRVASRPRLSPPPPTAAGCTRPASAPNDRIPPAGGHPAASSTSRVAVHRRRRHTIGDIDAEVTAKRDARLPSAIRWTRYRIVIIVHLWQSSLLE